MISVKTIFDGEKVVVPDALRGQPASEVFIVFPNDSNDASDVAAWMNAQEDEFATVWANDEDAVYDTV